MEIQLTLSTDRPDLLLNELLDSESGSRTYVNESLLVELESHNQTIGMSPSPDILALAVTFGSSFAISLFANWVYDKLKQDSKDIVSIKIGSVIVLTKDELVSELRKRVSEDN